jgi:hypothetical protein
LRFALRSHQDLDETRREMTAALLEKRMAAIATDQHVTRRRM